MSPEQLVMAISVLVNLILGIGALVNNRKSVKLDSSKASDEKLDKQFARTLSAIVSHNNMLVNENKELRELLREGKSNGRESENGHWKAGST